MAGATAESAGRVRLAVCVRLRLRVLGRPARRPGCAGDAERGSGPSSSGSRPGPTTGRRSPAPARSRSRCGSSANGARCARTPLRVASGSSATSRSTSPPTAATTPATRSSSCRSTRSSRARRRMTSTTAASSGAIRSTTGTRCGRRATGGGSSGCGGCSPSSTSFRIDHFRAFAAYWTVAAGAETAEGGWWSPGPGAAPFRAAEAELGELPVIAEDLGVITPDVHALRDELGFPGMAVFLWSSGGPADNPHRLENHRVNQVVYTSTHDTDTLAGFTGEPDVWPLIDEALSSPCAARDRPRAGRARARQRGADEPPRRGGRQLGVAPRARAADGGTRAPAPRGERGERPCLRRGGRRVARASPSGSPAHGGRRRPLLPSRAWRGKRCCGRDSGRLQGSAPAAGGIEPQDSAPAESCLASQRSGVAAATADAFRDLPPPQARDRAAGIHSVDSRFAS